MRLPLLFSTLLLPLLARAAEPPFPLAPGATWTYKITADGKPTDLSITAKEGPALAGQPTLRLNDQLLITKPDGVYLLATLVNDKPQLLPDPARLIPATPKLGDKWTYKTPDGATAAAACLGDEPVTVPAGTYTAIKVYAVASAGRDAATRSEINTWYAPGVGPVKETISTTTTAADGTPTIKETTRELTAYTPPGGAAPAKPAAAEDAVAKLFAEGETLARAGDHAAALAKYDQALAKDPKAAKVLAYKAVSLTATRKYNDASQAAAAAIALDPKEFTYHEIAGQALLAQGKIDAGKALYDKAAALAPESAGTVYLDLAAALSARRDPALAAQVQAALEKSAAATPPHPDALFALGQSYVSAGKLEGKAYLQRYLAAEAKLPEAQRDAQKIQLAKQLIRAIDAVKAAQ